MDLISVIVPVYKVEKYLNQCIQSIVEQTYTQLEIILVDDGSPDKSGEICDAWEQKDARIKVIHQENGGGAKARNTGLDLAKGDFITFVDSDDYIAPCMYEFLHDQFQQDTDIVECEYVVSKDGNAAFDRKETDCQITEYNTLEAMREHILDRKFKQSLINKLYRRQVIGELRMTENKKIDDEFFMYRILGNANRLIHCDKILYAYRQQEDSAMHSIDVFSRLQAVEARSYRHEYICRYMKQLENISLLNLWFTCIYVGQLVQKEADDKERKAIFIYLQNRLEQYPFSNGKMAGVKLTSRVWITMAKISLKMVCKIRNQLGIGL